MTTPGNAPVGQLEVRISDDEPVRIAQLIPGFPRWDQAERWLCMTAPDGLLTATLLHDDEVAGWRVIWPLGAPQPRRPLH